MMDLEKLAEEAEIALEDRFRQIDRVARAGTEKVLAAFREERVDTGMFESTTGYGYDDRGRDTLDRIYARVFGAERAFVRHSILSGTHALTVGLFGLLRPGDTLLAITGKPYDTLDEVIGISGERGRGSLMDFGVRYREIPLLPNGAADTAAIREGLKDPTVKVAFIQRSKGYMS